MHVNHVHVHVNHVNHVHVHVKPLTLCPPIYLPPRVQDSIASTLALSELESHISKPLNL